MHTSRICQHMNNLSGIFLLILICLALGLACSQDHDTSSNLETDGVTSNNNNDSTNKVEETELGTGTENGTMSSSDGDPILDSVCDLGTQPSPNWGERDGICLPACSSPGGNLCAIETSCPQGTIQVAGSFYDCNVCCMEMTNNEEESSICNSITQPTPNWGERNGICLPSCSTLGGTICVSDPSCPAGSQSTDLSYDCNVCCVDINDDVNEGGTVENNSGGSEEMGGSEDIGGMIMDDRSIPTTLTAILDNIPGFAAGTIGGRDGTLYTVTTLASSGPGSLKYALESTEPLWIVFAPNINGVIIVDDNINVKSFKTIDGRGHTITLRSGGDPWSTGLELDHSNEDAGEHVIFLNLAFDGQWPNYRDDSEGNDGIHIRNGAHHIWIHHCRFNNWADGAIDAKRDEEFPAPHHISITSSYFTRIFQVASLGVDNITFARNVCDDIGKRCIKIIQGGNGHMVNNIVKHWTRESIIASKDDSDLFVDHNIFEPGPERNAGSVQTEDSRIAGRWSGTHNYKYNGNVSWLHEGDIDSDFYSAARDAYSHHDCNNDDPTCWEAFYQELMTEAGNTL